MKIKEKIISIILLGFCFGINTFQTAFGQSDPFGGGRVEIAQISGVTNQSFIPGVVSVMNYLFSFLSFIMVLLIIRNGATLAAGGGEDEFNAAKDGIKYSLIGLLLIILSYSIVNFMITIGTSVSG